MERIEVALDNGAYAPTRAHNADAGLDLKSPMGVKVTAGNAVTIDSGVHVGIPEGYVGLIKSRSGLNVRYGLQCEGVIDAGYTGSIRIKLYNNGSNDILIERGDRIAQLVILPIITPAVQIVKNLRKTDRGNGGFGSTGK